jgi:hypothetical protein
MFIDHNNAAYFLAERGLLEFESVVEGDFLIADQSSRNRNLRIVRRKSPGFFIKQVGQQAPEFLQSMQREAACYQLANENPDFQALLPLTPGFHYFDPINHILIIELLSDSESLWEYHRRVNCFPVEIAKLQGEKLGTYHRSVRMEAQNGNQRSGLEVFARQIPWILSIHETNPAYLNQVSRGNAQLIGIVQQYPEFQNALASIKQHWKYSALIHGDIKWENILLVTHNGAEPELRLIDWEIADIGDECWDAGAIIQAYLTFWVFSLPLSTGMPVADAAANAPFSGDDIKRALSAYWLSYAESRGLGQNTGRRMLIRSMNCAAARMIQTAYESIQSSPQMSPYALCKLQMSMNILRDPQAAVGDLMGL